MIAFGPVPSRRLGRSLGVNNIPPKHCSYSCTYCQVGATSGTEVGRRTFYAPRDVVAEVERKVNACRDRGAAVDYVTFVPDGEPTLDAHLGEELRALGALGLSTAVITNGSLLWREDVRADLSAAAVVCVKVDTVHEPTWHRLNRPCARLDLSEVLDGMAEFARAYAGTLLSETMLVAGMNDDPDAVGEVAEFVARLKPWCAYLAVPTRPPAVSSVTPPHAGAVVRAFELMAERLLRVELLTGEEEGEFGHTGDPTAELLGILAIHPMHEDTARAYLVEAAGAPDLFDALVAEGRIVRVRYRDRTFVTCPPIRQRESV